MGGVAEAVIARAIDGAEGSSMRASVEAESVTATIPTAGKRRKSDATESTTSLLGPSPQALAQAEARRELAQGPRQVPAHMLPTVAAPLPEIEPPAHLTGKERRKWYKAQRVTLDEPVKPERRRDATGSPRALSS